MIAHRMIAHPANAGRGLNRGRWHSLSEKLDEYKTLSQEAEDDRSSSENGDLPLWSIVFTPSSGSGHGRKRIAFRAGGQEFLFPGCISARCDFNSHPIKAANQFCLSKAANRQKTAVCGLRQSTVSSVFLNVCCYCFSIPTGSEFFHDGSIIKTNENRKGYTFRLVFFSWPAFLRTRTILPRRFKAGDGGWFN